jgi:hypothetical protein
MFFVYGVVVCAYLALSLSLSLSLSRSLALSRARALSLSLALSLSRACKLVQWKQGRQVLGSKGWATGECLERRRHLPYAAQRSSERMLMDRQRRSARPGSVRVRVRVRVHVRVRTGLLGTQTSVFWSWGWGSGGHV